MVGALRSAGRVVLCPNGFPRLRPEAGDFPGGEGKVNDSGKMTMGRLPRPEEDNRKLHRWVVRACVSFEDS